ncbi:MAG: bacteriophage holin [Candidatus Pacebacteria bacterium]|nr:bacteriophage holin [Candidatus Paceibacterota bacterium]MCD8508098.1 bacteriophage holin [Candidatus Paceibacterota bacterium]MCD8528090.1 bacteriophage holin [Candidatus Paceibacterota bacterium]MCD8563733.1 bacteriophage holin [Candidatus Paceibacterota bacterium]
MKTTQRIDGIRLGLAGGIVIGFSLFFLTIIASMFGYGVELLDILKFYPGYDITPGGAALGFVWGFVDGFIFFALLAWLYNHIHLYHG